MSIERNLSEKLFIKLCVKLEVTKLGMDKLRQDEFALRMSLDVTNSSAKRKMEIK